MGGGTSESKNTNGENIGFEATLWAAADKLRGHMDASEYKHAVLPLLFLNFVSHAFQHQCQDLKKNHAAPEDRDEYAAASIFCVSKKARWSCPDGLQANAKQTDIGKHIDDAMTALEKENQILEGVLPIDYNRPSLDKTNLGKLIDTRASPGSTPPGAARSHQKACSLSCYTESRHIFGQT